MEDPGARNLWFSVSKEERKEMKAGREVLKHYHDIIFPDDTVAVVVGKPWIRSKYNYLLARGIDIVPVELTDKQIDLLDSQACVCLCKSPLGIPIKVHVVDEGELMSWRLEGRI